MVLDLTKNVVFIYSFEIQLMTIQTHLDYIAFVYINALTSHVILPQRTLF